jgi:high frequency lysogenization protein
MSLNNTTNQTIALAGISQTCLLVQQLATQGKADDSAIETSIASTLRIDSDSVLDIYGGLPAIKPGLEQLQLQMTGRQIADPEQGRYAAQLVFLEMQLSNRPEMLVTIKRGIEKAEALDDSRIKFTFKI